MKSNVLLKGQLLRDIIATEPTDIKHIILSKLEWDIIRPYIKDMQKYGFWYDISEYYNELYIRVKVNDITEKYIQSLIDLLISD